MNQSGVASADEDLLTAYALTNYHQPPPPAPVVYGHTHDLGVLEDEYANAKDDVEVGPSGGEGDELGVGEDGAEGQPKKKRKLKSSAPRTSRACRASRRISLVEARC